MISLLHYLFLTRLHGGSRRYRNLFRLIKRNRCKVIVEIGTNRAKNALRMIMTAGIHHRAPEIRYFGFDLFEGLGAADLKKEFSKVPASLREVRDRLEKTGAAVMLFKGYTSTTLPEFVSYAKTSGLVPDFVFIDGGHAIETIASDWREVQKVMDKNTVVVFDDYYHGNDPHLEGLGCNSIVSALDPALWEVAVLPPVDSFTKEWGTLRVSLVSVRRRTAPLP